MFLFFLCVFGANSLAVALGREDAAVRSAEQNNDFSKLLEIFISKIISEKTILFHRVRPPDTPVEKWKEMVKIIPKNIIQNYNKIHRKNNIIPSSDREFEFETRKQKYKSDDEINSLFVTKMKKTTFQTTGS